VSHDLEALSQWIGKTEEVADLINPWPVSALQATLGGSQTNFSDGDVLPPLWHWLYFKPSAASSSLGHDGHPVKGGFLPPITLPRRMWAGGRLSWHTDNPLCVGQSVTRQSRIAAITPKTGRSGQMVFVSVVHEVHNTHGICVVEEQDIVFREESKGSSVSAAIAPDLESISASSGQRRYLPDEVMLFRYSALTFNSHRIHYDRPYASQVEGYPGLVVHGPLIATLLAEFARHEYPLLTMRQFGFRALVPAFDGHPLEISALDDGPNSHFWAQDEFGRRLMQADVQFAQDAESGNRK
jgi:3-methylfumaryl-CoA hydratase